MTKIKNPPAKTDMNNRLSLLRSQILFGWKVVLVLSTSFVFGCSSKVSNLQAKRAEADRFDREESQLIARYFDGDLTQARQSLTQTIQYIQQSKTLDEEQRAGDLALMYYRLYMFDKREKHEADAEIALVQARYWVVKNCELIGVSDSEIVRRITNDVNIAEHSVDEFDQGGNHGNKPKYLQFLTN